MVNLRSILRLGKAHVLIISTIKYVFFLANDIKSILLINDVFPLTNNITYLFLINDSIFKKPISIGAVTEVFVRSPVGREDNQSR